MYNYGTISIYKSCFSSHEFERKKVVSNILQTQPNLEFMSIVSCIEISKKHEITMDFFNSPSKYDSNYFSIPSRLCRNW